MLAKFYAVMLFPVCLLAQEPMQDGVTASLDFDRQSDFLNVAPGRYTVLVPSGPSDDPFFEESRRIDQFSSPMIVDWPARQTAQPITGVVSLRELQHPPKQKAVRDLIEAHQYWKAHDSAKAIAKLEEAIRIDPSFREAHINLGVQYARPARKRSDWSISHRAGDRSCGPHRLFEPGLGLCGARRLSRVGDIRAPGRCARSRKWPGQDAASDRFDALKTRPSCYCEDMSAARTLISVEEYLASVYEPDCDYVDGEVLGRNMGERDHAGLQTAVGAYFFARRKQWNITVLTEMRVQVKPTRFRIPDVCVVLGDTDEQILTKPPFLCIEILSPEDRWVRAKGRINDFLAMGVPYVWVVDAQTKQAYVATPSEGLREVKDGILRTENPAFHVPLSELFA